MCTYIVMKGSETRQIKKLQALYSKASYSGTVKITFFNFQLNLNFFFLIFYVHLFMINHFQLEIEIFITKGALTFKVCPLFLVLSL